MTKKNRIDGFKRIINNTRTTIGNFFWSKITFFAFFVIMVILLFIPFNTINRITYNIYKTAYQISDSIYCNYYIEYFAFFRLALTFIWGVCIYRIIKELKDKTNSKKTKIIHTLFFIPILIVLYYPYHSLILDLKYVTNDKYCTAESDLSRYRILMHVGGRGGAHYYYYLFLYDTDVEYKKEIINKRYSKRSIDNRRIDLSDEKKKLPLIL